MTAPRGPTGGVLFLPRSCYDEGIMSAIVEKLVDQVKALPKEQFDEFLAWLAEYEFQQPDAWDQQMERDSLPGGPLQDVIDRARNDIAAGRTKPLDEVLDDA